MHGSKIRDFLDETERRYPRMKPQFTRPPSLCEGRVPAQQTICICDYADSKKSDEWQAYAAASAAAHGKEILLQLQVQDIDRMSFIKNVLEGLSSCIESIADTTNMIRLKQLDDDERQILDWISPLEPGKTQSDYLAKTISGTGLWLLSDKRFLQWRANTGKTLFCPGIPGAGKTFLTSIVIDHLQKMTHHEEVGIAYFYCNFQSEQRQSARGLLSSLLKQLCGRLPSLPDSVKSSYKRFRKGTVLPSLEEISRALHQTVHSYTRVYILIDALDEYQEDQQPGNSWKTLLGEIFKLRDEAGVNIFATSRPIPTITGEFGYESTLEIRARDEDVMAFIN
ncbi:hypothetical protein IL306_012906 [Fusarium sp. DS 682]|nr:hypothetical protein IL306_012906 [Fusarium sp. DS 682]